MVLNVAMGGVVGVQVADVSEAVRQRGDALMLSGESAMGLYPEKALSVLRTVSLRMERWCREEKIHQAIRLPELSTALHERISEQISISAAQMGEYIHLLMIHSSRKRMGQPTSNLFSPVFWKCA